MEYIYFIKLYRNLQNGVRNISTGQHMDMTFFLSLPPHKYDSLQAFVIDHTQRESIFLGFS